MGFFDFLKSGFENVARSQARQREDFSRRYEREHPDMSSKERERLDNFNRKTERIADFAGASIRRTEEELSTDTTGLDKSPSSYQRKTHVPLNDAMFDAENTPGVYVLWLSGVAMKCGRSSQNGGVRKRLQEYYGLRYDKRAQTGEHWAVSYENRDDVLVSWQCCPISKCNELEYKLFRKYGKGPWAHNAPNYTGSDTWELLI
ncbi:MAG: hypothetical protein E7473_09440 [Ruminococcaceae bacterium]|nr:hypothetical protein [Oscillospiraceae bacterium]